MTKKYLGTKAVGVGGLGVCVFCEDLREQTVIWALGNVDLFVGHWEYANGLELQKVQRGLVINEGGAWDGDALSRIKRLLHLENVLIKVKLQLLIAKVDAQLLKRVNLIVDEKAKRWKGKKCFREKN